MIGAYPFRVGDDIRVSVRSSTGVSVVLMVRVRYVDGTDDVIEIDITSDLVDRSGEQFNSSDAFKKAGWVEHLTVRTSLNNARGRYYMMVAINKKPHHYPIAAGYIDVSHVPLGEFEPAISGSGYRHLLALADDIAPVDIIKVLAADNSYRIIYGFVWYYHCSSDIANRSIRATLRHIGNGLPTGWTPGNNSTFRFWPAAANLVLDADQEGAIYAGSQEGISRNVSLDDGVMTVEDAGSKPGIFPLVVREGDLAELFFNVTLAEAADRHSIYLDLEEWISP